MTQDELDLNRLEGAADAMAAAVTGACDIADRAKTPAVRQAAYSTSRFTSAR